MKNKMIIAAAAGLLACSLACAQKLSVSTNLMDWANVGTANAEVSRALSQHWSVNAGAKYNPFTFGGDGERAQSRQRSLSAGARYWPWNVWSGWWFGMDARWQEYNTGGFRSQETREGDRLGGSVKAGYAFMLTPHFNVDLGVGMWGGYDVYTVYDCPTCGRKVESGAKYFFKVSDIILNLSYIF